MKNIAEVLQRRVAADKDALQKLRNMEQNFFFAFDHLEEWRQQYPEKWTAVHDSRLVAVEGSVLDLRRALRDKNIPMRDVYLTYVHREKSDLVL